MNNDQATPDACVLHERVASGVARFLDQEITAMAPFSATLALCVVGSTQDLAVTTSRLTIIAILMVILLATGAGESPSHASRLRD
ncbi:hypothetical protein AB0945_05135 [Streptomyces sp. NPDC005474]|uniref:hypothetical protein n=1 Tax=Streptomyces sp. NPDC005474 TaxID=3154878 RepID=UPI00345374F0